MPELRPYYLNDEDINFIYRLIRSNLEFEDDEDDQDYFIRIANNIKMQIIDHCGE